MRRTLLAIGIAVLASMLFVPHRYQWDWGGRHWDWANSYRFPIFCVDDGRNPILWGNFVGQSMFAGVLAAVLVNIRWRRKKNLRQEKKPTPVEMTRDKVIQALKPGGFISSDGSIGWSPNDHILDIELDGKTINVWYETKGGPKYHVESFVGPVKVIQQRPIK